MKRGRLLEDTAVAEYAAKSGARVRRMKHRVHPDFDFMGCTLDRQHLAEGELAFDRKVALTVDDKAVEPVVKNGVYVYVITHGRGESTVKITLG